MVDDVIIVGAGPAGAVAAAILARAGARVRVIDRAAFPRDKLCGDTVNPGALDALRRLGMSRVLDERGLRVDGMRLTGPGGVAVEGRYPRGLFGRALLRRDLDAALMREAIASGAQFDDRVAVRRPLVSERGASRSVEGVAIAAASGERAINARVTIAADGRHSTLAFALGLASHPRRPRRWAIGAYYQDVVGTSSLGEMHVRRGRYIGIAAVPGGATNVCLVRPIAPADGPMGRLSDLLAAELGRDPQLADRFRSARMIGQPVTLGPLAVDVRFEEIPGLVLAGDAAGFIDPMTGDGLRFAVRGGELAAEAALTALADGWVNAHARLAAARQREFGSKWRFNRTVRAIVASSRAVDAAAVGARLAPTVFRRMVAFAGDCGLMAAR
jgi:flavin-dependent dehydrogenase